MEIRFKQPEYQRFDFTPALLLLAVLCSFFATLDSLYLLPVALIGILIPVIYCLLPKKSPVFFYTAAGILIAFLLIRFHAIVDGIKLLANLLFSQSEMQQFYEYHYFDTVVEKPFETVLWLGLLGGTLCALLRNYFTGILTAVWIIAMAYFGVTPKIGWLLLLGAACLLCIVPKQQKWFHGTAVILLLGITAWIAVTVSPTPNANISALDETLRDRLSLHSISYEELNAPMEFDEPEAEPESEDTSDEASENQGNTGKTLNILFIVLAVLTLLFLFIPAIFKDKSEKRRKINRADMDNTDNAVAIRAIWLYTQHWLKLSDTQTDVPNEIYAIWLEAAYSEHTMTQQQRECMYDYMKNTAEAVWQSADKKKRFNIQYRLAL